VSKKKEKKKKRKAYDLNHDHHENPQNVIEACISAAHVE
jgi:hypothetical protein